MAFVDTKKRKKKKEKKTRTGTYRVAAQLKITKGMVYRIAAQLKIQSWIWSRDLLRQENIDTVVTERSRAAVAAAATPADVNVDVGECH